VQQPSVLRARTLCRQGEESIWSGVEKNNIIQVKDTDDHFRAELNLEGMSQYMASWMSRNVRECFRFRSKYR
jgi:hypothetical protein